MHGCWPCHPLRGSRASPHGSIFRKCGPDGHRDERPRRSCPRSRPPGIRPAWRTGVDITAPSGLPTDHPSDERYGRVEGLDCAGSRAVATRPYSTGLAARSDVMSGPRRAAGSGQLAGDRRRGRTERRLCAPAWWRVRAVRASIGAAHPSSWAPTAWLGPALLSQRSHRGRINHLPRPLRPAGRSPVFVERGSDRSVATAEHPARGSAV